MTSYGYFVYNLALDDLAGGHSWKQGDWLINSMSGPVRRSLTGNVLIWISDALMMDPVRVVIIAQSLIVGVLYLLTVWMVFTSPRDLVRLILAMSPAFFMTFWIADPLGSARKEMFAFIALLVFSQGLGRNNAALGILGSLLFVLAVAIHEAMILFAPVFWAILFLTRSKVSDANLQTIVLGMACLVATAVFLDALGQGQVEDFMNVCQPLLDRGVKEHMCHGSIKWLEFDLAYGVESVASRTTLNAVFLLMLTYAICLLPSAYVVYLSERRAVSLVLLLSPIFCFLPLFFIAVDHGRWISFHIFAGLVLCSAAVSQGQMRIVRRPNTWVLLILGLASLLFAPTHIRDVYWGGVVRRALEELTPLLLS